MKIEEKPPPCNLKITEETGKTRLQKKEKKRHLKPESRNPIAVGG